MRLSLNNIASFSPSSLDLVWQNSWMEYLCYTPFCVGLLVDSPKRERKNFGKPSEDLQGDCHRLYCSVSLFLLPSCCCMTGSASCKRSTPSCPVDVEFRHVASFGQWLIVKGCDIGHIWADALRVSAGFYQPSCSIASAMTVAWPK